MNKYLLLIIAGMFFAGCRQTVEIKQISENDSKAIPLLDLAVYQKNAEYTAAAGQDFAFVLNAGFDGGMAAPADILLDTLKKISAVNHVTLIIGGNDGCINQWNLFAVEEYFNSICFDRKQARKDFLREKFGNSAPAMEEYFRVVERQYFSLAGVSGFGTPSYPTASEVCRNGFLKDIEKCLEKALQSADTEEAKNAILKEMQIMKERSRILRDTVKKNIRRVCVNENIESEFLTVYGDKADVKTTLKLEADDKYLKLTLTAEEPIVSRNRISQVRPRDFANMWAEDGFEIFLIPDEKKTSRGWQFIVNSRGCLWDAAHYRRGACDPKWNAENAKVDFSEKQGQWQVILTVPWSDLGFNGMPEKRFLANIYRNRAAHGAARSTYAWSPIYNGAYYQAEKFGYFIWNKEEK